MRWDDLKFFLAVARSGQLTTAAKGLKVDNATVARRIRALESALDARLFDRNPKGYSLTEVGQRLLPAAEAMETSTLEAQAQVQGRDESLEGVVRLGAPDGFGSFFLAPRIHKLARRHPKLELQLVAMPRIFSLSKREADVSIAITRPKSGRLRVAKLTDYHLHLYATGDYLKESPPIQQLEDLKQHSMIGYISDLIFDPKLDYMPILGRKVVPQISSTNLIAQLNATLAGAGICILPDFLAGEQSGLQPVLRKTFSLTRTFWIVSHENTASLRRIRETVDFIKAEVRENRDIF
ncbi:LysR family transcriptional regulator [Pelagibius sp.]|uniref:LysR family transcriptional regulator n=1 Tax=Pelagibius sp. TaxID=1931238 RepID=UPI002621653D|nr:LysR family transcriptional regulator [Pelagibius sp.]